MPRDTFDEPAEPAEPRDRARPSCPEALADGPALGSGLDARALSGLLDRVGELIESRHGGRVTERRPHELITAVRTDGDHAGSTASEGGETACLLHRVCPECGRFAEVPGARSCALCGTALPTG